MKQFKEHKITVKQILDRVPSRIIEQLALDTNVNHYAKVLNGKNIFSLLLYGILENDKLSQRSLEDTFNSDTFKQIFQLCDAVSVRRSSISERLAKINPDYFKQIYNHLYTTFSQLYSPKESEKYNLIRVDSTIVTDVSGRMEQGLISRNQSSIRKKTIKYSVAFDGLFPCGATVFNETSYSNEDNALPEAIKNHVMQHPDSTNIYIVDRGLQSSKNMQSFSDNEVKFVCRLKEKRRYKELDTFITDKTELEFDGLNLILDSKVNLYTRSSVLEHDLRLVIVERKDDNARFLFATNDFDLTAREIAAYYKRRWDIEVFFRFIKQELNASHLVSLNKNGIEVMLYMTMISAMLILIYKRENNIGYTTAKRRFAMEIRNMAIAVIVQMCGGNPDLFFKT